MVVLLSFLLHQQYLRHGDRGILLFGATQTVIRNGRICEAPFDVQREVISRGEPGVTMPSSFTLANHGGSTAKTAGATAGEAKHTLQLQLMMRRMHAGMHSTLIISLQVLRML